MSEHFKISGAHGRRHILYAIHLGNDVCGPPHYWEASTNGVRFIKFAKCQFVLLTDTSMPIVGKINLLPLVAKFHHNHHRQTGPKHGPWTVTMRVQPGRNPMVRLACTGVRIG